jgi:hypothetical protein
MVHLFTNHVTLTSVGRSDTDMLHLTLQRLGLLDQTVRSAIYHCASTVHEMQGSMPDMRSRDTQQGMPLRRVPLGLIALL